MRSATALVHDALGRPRFSEAVDLPDGTLCWMCGGSAERGIPVKDYGGRGFVGQNRVRAWASPWVCEPCVLITSWMTPALLPVPGVVSKEGAKRDANWRNYSVLYDDGHVIAVSKGEKPRIRDWLRAPKQGVWFCALAESGQKHVAPWVPVQPAGARPGRVLFEERELTLGDWTMLDDVTALLTAGASKEEIGTADYRPETWIRCGTAIDAFDQRWSGERSSAWWDLCLWLAQRDEEAVANRLVAEKETKKNGSKRAKAKDPGRSRSRAAPSDPGGVPGEPAVQRPEALDVVTGAGESGGKDDGNGRGVGHVVASWPTPGRSVKGQLSLFDGTSVGSARRK